MHILIIEPFYSGSHKQWIDGYQKHSSHRVEILSLPGRYWKWRMHGAAISLANEFLKRQSIPDLLVVSDMLDFACFKALVGDQLQGVKTAIYFHENQFAYPKSSKDSDIKAKRDNHYAWINYTSALTANRVFFNSDYNKSSFFEGLKNLLPRFPDFQELEMISILETKSEVLLLGMELKDMQDIKQKNEVPVILWNHRWEYDKGPELFFKTLERLKKEGISFKLNVLGQSFKNQAPCFQKAKEQFKEEILHFGYLESLQDYHEVLQSSDILPVTSLHDFFGVSVIEAIYSGNYPLLPDRLAYPEHIRESEKDKYFYLNEEDFYQRLKELIISKSYLEESPNLDQIKKYSWKNMSMLYDMKFRLLCDT